MDSPNTSTPMHRGGRVDAQRQVSISPDQLIAMIIGSDSVVLHGFGAAPAKLPLWVPVVSSYDPSISASASTRATRLLRAFVWPSVLMVMLTAATLAYWFGQVEQEGSLSKAALAPWTVKSVEENSVLVVIGKSKVRIAVGSLLPSGEILRSVDPKRQNFSTDSQITVVKK